MPERYTHYPRTLLWLVPGGEITLGGPEADAGPRFRVAVEPFYLSKFPVTNEQFEAFDPGYERLPCSPGDRDPAVGVTFDEAAAYCAWYAGVARKPMRLPSEIEWEYACRGGSEARYFFGDDPSEADLYLWDAVHSDGRVQPLDAKKANAFGLYGMLGGVWDWTSSPYRPYPPVDNAPPAADGEPRVLRGGSFRLHREEISCSLRRAADPGARCDDVGFRVAKSLR